MIGFTADDDKLNHRDCPRTFRICLGAQMEATLPIRYQVISYSDNGREIYYPASSDSSALAEKLREAKAKGLHAWLSQVK